MKKREEKGGKGEDAYATTAESANVVDEAVAHAVRIRAVA
jgi:hypothetical protein